MTFAHNPAALGASAPSKKLSATRIDAVPIATLALVGTVILAVVTLSSGNAISAQIRSLSEQIHSLEQAIQANQQKVSQLGASALTTSEMKQVQADAPLAASTKDVEAFRNSSKVASPASTKKDRAKVKAETH